MKLIDEILSRSQMDTKKFALGCKNKIKNGSIVELVGDLGSGKTFFVKCFCENLGINNVSSPTFAIVNEYINSVKIYHFDFYRIKHVRELYDIGIFDYLNNNEAVIFIEWADLFQEVIPLNRHKISFEILNDNERKIKFFEYER